MCGGAWTLDYLISKTTQEKSFNNKVGFKGASAKRGLLTVTIRSGLFGNPGG